MISAVYMIHTPDFSHYYIGSSQNANRRLKDHRCRLHKGEHKNKSMQAAHDHSESFLFDIAHVCHDKKEAEALEAELLAFHHGKPGCMNASSTPHALACPVLRLRHPRTAEHKAAISESRKRQLGDGAPMPNTRRPVIRIGADGSETWFASGKAGGDAVGIAGVSVSRAARGDRATSAGYRWRYA